MSQTDLNVANASGAVVRADLNDHFQALATNSSGATSPTTTFPHQWWFDESTNDLKQRNVGNTAWILVARKDGSGWTPYRQGVLIGVIIENPLTAVLDTGGFAIDFSEGANVASASTANIWATDGNTVHITGAVTITSLGTAPRAGAVRWVIFDAALTLTHGADLNLPGSADITTVAGDFARVYADTTTQLDVQYFRADGTAVVGGVVQATRVAIEAETNEDTYAPPDLIKNSPGVVKFWANVDRSAGTPSLNSPSYNVDSVTDDGAGNTIVTIATDMSSIIYAAGATARVADGGGDRYAVVHTLAVGAVDVEVRIDSGSTQDTTDFTCYGFGDQ